MSCSPFEEILQTKVAGRGLAFAHRKLTTWPATTPVRKPERTARERPKSYLRQTCTTADRGELPTKPNSTPSMRKVTNRTPSVRKVTGTPQIFAFERPATNPSYDRP